ncbi:MAG: DUF2304 family protein [Candidatus Woesearchaeota archaeon]
MEFIHITVIIFSVFALSRAFLRWREAKITLGELLFWVMIWVGGITVAFFPGLITFLSNRAGFGRGMDFVLVLSVVVLFYLLFRIYVKLEEIEQRITKVVRAISKK